MGVRTGAQAGWAGPKESSGLAWCREALGTYSQRTIKDVHTAGHTSLAAPGPPREGEQAGERRESQRLCERARLG